MTVRQNSQQMIDLRRRHRSIYDREQYFMRPRPRPITIRPRPKSGLEILTSPAIFYYPKLALLSSGSRRWRMNVRGETPRDNVIGVWCGWRDYNNTVWSPVSLAWRQGAPLRRTVTWLRRYPGTQVAITCVRSTNENRSIVCRTYLTARMYTCIGLTYRYSTTTVARYAYLSRCDRHHCN